MVSVNLPVPVLQKWELKKRKKAQNDAKYHQILRTAHMFSVGSFLCFSIALKSFLSSFIGKLVKPCKWMHMFNGFITYGSCE